MRVFVCALTCFVLGQGLRTQDPCKRTFEQRPYQVRKVGNGCAKETECAGAGCPRSSFAFLNQLANLLLASSHNIGITTSQSHTKLHSKERFVTRSRPRVSQSVMGAYVRPVGLKTQSRKEQARGRDSNPDTMSFMQELYSQPATEVRDGVEFMKYDDHYVNPPLEVDPLEREVMLYIPGLDFSGVSGCGSFPSLASRYELWRCRVQAEDRSTYAELVHTVASFVESQISRGKDVTLIGESFGGLLAVGVADRLMERLRSGALDKGLKGIILVNPATGFNEAPISIVGPMLASLPADKLPLLMLPDIQLVNGNTSAWRKPQVSIYSVLAGAFLGATVPDVPQIVSMLKGVINDISAFDAVTAPVAGLEKVSNAVVALDTLASRLPPGTLAWRLNYWLSAGCSRIDYALKRLKDTGVPVLVLAGDQDRLLPSVREAKRLEKMLGLRSCQVVVLKDTGHAALDGRVDILNLIDKSPQWKIKRKTSFSAGPSMAARSRPPSMKVVDAARRAACVALLALLSAPSTLAPSAALAATADRVDTETGKLVLNQPPTVDITVAPPKVTSRCFLDVSIAGVPAGRLDIELYGEIAPKAAENFRCLCTKEKGFGYAGSTFYKVLEGLAVQGGDVDGNGEGRSIYGEPFVHDGYDIMHNVAGLVSMVNTGVGGSSGKSDSRFLIQPIPDAGFLDGRYEAFGRVYNGLDVVMKINAVSVGGNKKKPVDRVTIDAAGEYTE